MEQKETSRPDYEGKFKDFIADLTGRCFDVAEDLYAKVCDRVTDRLNNLSDENIAIEGSFPPSFTYVDKLSHRIKCYSYEEIGDNLEGIIRGLIKEETGRLSAAEILVLELSTVEFTPDNRADMSIVYDRIMTCFEEKLDDRWEATVGMFSEPEASGK